MGYLIKSAYNQISLLNQRVPIEKALKDPSLSKEEKQKLELALQVREFADKQLNLNAEENYTTFVKLDRPYVSYAVSAAPKWKLESYLWSFPIVGKVPYKGYFSKSDAEAEADELKKKDLDVYVRGVPAYSTLGWFKDPLLSSMMSYKEHDLVNTIIHESVHATLFIKSAADFNERMATFIGNKGMELFYLQKEGEDSSTLKLIKDENSDDDLFSLFITKELNDLILWYSSINADEKSDHLRNQKFQSIQEKFKKEILPKLKTNTWKRFSDWNLNNARLVVFKTYMKDLNDFNELFDLVDKNFSNFLNECKKLETVKDPEKSLKDRIQELKTLQKK
ncbi:MAG: aminopeptidase [Bdellovibrionales bacterium]|nr:aminopeptidase [Bdellovibrionales bacterium]